MKRLLRSRTGRAGLALALLLVLVAVVGPMLTHDPNVPDYANQLQAPGHGHVLGTDAAGRDLLARTMTGARNSLRTVALVFTLATTIGLLVGALAGFARGPVDAVLSRVIDVLMSLPQLIVALAIVGTLGVGAGHLTFALVATSWAYSARLARSLVLDSHRRLDVVSARMAGVHPVTILLTHVVPGTVGTVLVQASAQIGEIVLNLAGLSFLGLGAQPPTAELGQMLAEAQSSIASAPWQLLGPSAVIVLTVAAGMLLSDALRSASDPGLRRIRRRSTTHSIEATAALAIDQLAVTYPGDVHAVRGVTFAVAPGECLALVGESGSGKTSVARAVLGLLPVGTAVEGTLAVGPTAWTATGGARRDLRGRAVGYVGQDPYAACDPLRSVGHHVEEPWRVHGLPVPDGDAEQRVQALGVIGRLTERPTRWSGGMLQRATVAAAGVHEPPVTIADEPTSALDADLGHDAIALLRSNSDALLLVSHDLDLVADHSDLVAVMYAGRIVETGPTAEVVTTPRHPYTRALLAATPREGGGLLVALTGNPPSLRGELPPGCPFADRCPEAIDRCHDSEPDLHDGVACWVAT
jgi:peptide/nickel transport system permease protein